MKKNNLQKKPGSAEEYADLFLLDENGKKRDFSKANSVCFITIGHAETLWILLQEFAGKDIAIIDRKSEIDFIEALIKIHNRDDIKIVQKFEVETEDAVLNTIFNKDMSFDLIIANPPYGKSSSLSKKIVNKMLECKVAEEMVVLAPPRTFYDVCTNLVDYSYKGVCGNLFDSVSEANDVLIALARLDNNINTKYTSYLDFVLDEKEKTYNNVVKAYNNSHEPFYTDVSSKRVDFRNKSLFKGVSDKVIFAIPYWTPFSGIRKGECKKYNFDETPINWEAKSSAQGAVLKNNTVKRNFAKWWYSCVGGLNTLKENKTLMYLILRCVKDVYSGTPGLSAYFEFIPNLDWSRSWTDEEILKELGLPEDFLEEKE